MKHYSGFQPSGMTYTERDGEPEDFPASIGRVALAFNDLEDETSIAISKLLGIDEEISQIITAEMSFRNKVHLMGSLLRRALPFTMFNTGYDNPEEMVSELISQCFRAEELRNQIMHSSYVRLNNKNGEVKRNKITSKATRGLNISSEVLDPGLILDISDFIVCISDDIANFFLVCSPKEQ